MKNEILINFTLIYNKFKKPVFNYLMKILRSEMLAEDIAHNVFLKLFENLEKIRNAEKIEIWIFKTTRNEVFNYFRKTKRQVHETFENHEEKLFARNTLEEIEGNEFINIIEAELDKMDSSQSEVFYLKEYSKLSYKEIGEIMNISEDLVRSRLFKVRQKLKLAIIKVV